MKINKGDIYLAKGEIKVEIKSGSFELIGAIFKSGEINIPEGKQMPFICKEAGELVPSNEKFEKLDHNTIPENWYAIAERIAKENIKRVVILGEVDTGKSFFSIFLANRLTAMNKRTGIIDSDTGQSDIGAPGTIGFGIFDKHYFALPDVPVQKQYFIGNHSPGGLFTVFLAGIAKIAAYAEKHTDCFIVNTTGWTHGDGARCLKKAKLEIVDPDLAILMQRDSELEHLTAHMPDEKIVRLSVSRKATPTSQTVRKELREKISRRCFAGSRKIALPFSGFKFERVFLGSGKPLETKENEILYAEKLPAWEGHVIIFKEDTTPAKAGEIAASYRARYCRPSYLEKTFVGLADADGFAIAVGSVEKADFLKKELTVVTDLETGREGEIKFVQMGSLRYSSDGNEAGFILPSAI